MTDEQCRLFQLWFKMDILRVMAEEYRQPATRRNTVVTLGLSAPFYFSPGHERPIG